MSIGLVGKKCGMTRVFSEIGESIPITVIEVLPNRITQVKTKDKDGYSAIQVTTGTKKLSKVNKPLAGHFAKANVAVGDGLWEFILESTDIEANDFSVGKEMKIDVFKIGQLVDVQGVTKGKGFAGVIKRHHFSGGAASHGNSLSHRAPGSIGQRQTPGRVFKGKKMAGHLGNVNRTVHNQEIINIDSGRNLIMIKGCVPGAPSGYVILTPAVKVKRGANNGA